MLMIMLSSAIDGPKFLGEEYTSNVSHLGARHLSIVTSRFLTQDTKKQYSSHYNYGNGNIIVNSDPSGYTLTQDIKDAFDAVEEVEKSDEIAKKDTINENITHITVHGRPNKLTVTNNIITSNSAPFLDEHGMSIRVEREPDTRERRAKIIARQKTLRITIDPRSKLNGLKVSDPSEFKPAWDSVGSPFYDKYEDDKQGYSFKQRALMAAGVVTAQLIVVGSLIAILTTQK